jgi:hypothetical protein
MTIQQAIQKAYETGKAEMTKALDLSRPCKVAYHAPGIYRMMVELNGPVLSDGPSAMLQILTAYNKGTDEVHAKLTAYTTA